MIGVASQLRQDYLTCENSACGLLNHILHQLMYKETKLQLLLAVNVSYIQQTHDPKLCVRMQHISFKVQLDY